MKRYSKAQSYRAIIVLILFSVCFSLNARAQNVQVEARLDRVSIPLGDQTILHVAAHIPAKSDITFPLLADSIAGKIKIVNSLRPDTAFDKNNPAIETITHNYTITSFDTGVYVVPQLTFHTKNGDYNSGTVTLQITAVHVDTTKAVYDIKQPFAVSYNFWDWLADHWIWVVSGLVLILFIAWLVHYHRNRPQTVFPLKKAGPVLPADAIALNKLYELRDKKLWQGDEVKQYYSELTDVLREYLEKRYQVKAHEQTTDEIFAGLKHKDIPKDSRSKLKEILVLADLVKFAKEKPLPVDNELCMEYAIGFVVQTKPDIKPADDKEDLPK